MKNRKTHAARRTSVPTSLPIGAANVMGSYLVVLAMMSLGFRAGGTVATLYPVYALTYVWAAVIGARFHGHAISSWNVVGMGCLVLGVTLMSVGSAGRV